MQAREVRDAVVPVGVEVAQTREGVGAGGVEVGERGVEGVRLRGVFAREQRAGEWRGCSAMFREKTHGRLARGADAHEAVGEHGRNWRRLREEFGCCQFEQMPQARRGFAQRLMRGVELREGFRAPPRVGMQHRASPMKFIPQIRGIEPRTAGKIEKGEGVGHVRQARQVRAGGFARKPIFERRKSARTFPLSPRRARG